MLTVADIQPNLTHNALWFDSLVWSMFDLHCFPSYGQPNSFTIAGRLRSKSPSRPMSGPLVHAKICVCFHTTPNKTNFPTNQTWVCWAWTKCTGCESDLSSLSLVVTENLNTINEWSKDSQLKHEIITILVINKYNKVVHCSLEMVASWSLQDVPLPLSFWYSIINLTGFLSGQQFRLQLLALDWH